MDICYTARATFSKEYDEYGLGWNGYIAWRGLSHLEEVVSVDGLLNRNLIESDQKNTEDREYVVMPDNRMTTFYRSLDYVLRKTERIERFNLLALAVEPAEDCRNINLIHFEFTGYDLADDWYSTSSLTNCDGLILSYSPGDLNQFALLKEFEKAYDVKKRLLEDNPGHGHENTRVIGVWRHKTIGRVNLM